MSKILPVIIAILGLAAGAGAGFVLRPAEKPAEHAPDMPSDNSHADPHAEKPSSQTGVEFVKLNNQFIVPVVENGAVSALVVVALSLEVAQGEREAVYLMEPRIRDVFLRVLFDHANSGGFRGTFTASTNMSALRIALLEAAQKALGPGIKDVLIIDLVRQDT